MSNAALNNWEKRIFSDVIKLNYGKSPKDIFHDSGKYPVIGTGGVTGYTNDYLHDGGTIVIGRKGTIDKPSFIVGKFWAIDTTYFVSDYQNIDAKWFYYFLQNIDLTRFNEASGVPSLNRDTLYAIPCICPPLPEQQKIAAILTAVDDVIESTQAQSAKLKDLKAGMMQELLTKGIGHTEFKDSPVGRIPATWKIKTLNELIKSDSPICYGILMPGAHVIGGTPVIKVKDIKDNQINEIDLLLTSKEIDEKYARSRIQCGDTLLTIRGSTGRLAIVPESLNGANITQDTARIRIGSSELSKFIFTYLQSASGQEQIEFNTIGQAVKGINIGEVRKIIIGLPPMEERKLIAGAISSIDNKLFIYFNKMKSLVSTKKALMQDLLTGKVRVNVSVN